MSPIWGGCAVLARLRLLFRLPTLTAIFLHSTAQGMSLAPYTLPLTAASGVWM